MRSVRDGGWKHLLAAVLRIAVLPAIVFASGLLPKGIAHAVPSENIAEVRGDGASAEALGDVESLGTCGTLRWVSHSPRSLTVYLTKGSSSKSETTPAAKLTLSDGDTAYAFCTDIHHGASSNDSYCLDSAFFSDWRIAWVVTNYPPSTTDRQQHAARQAAVWHFSDGYDLNQTNPTDGWTSDDTAVMNYYNAILAAVPATPPAEYETGNVSLVIDPATDTNFLPGEEEQAFTVRLTKGTTPLVGYTIGISSGFGSLDKTSAVTNGSGEAYFTLTSSSAGSAAIAAGATVTLPAGSRFIHQTDPDGHQRLVLGESTTVTVQAQATEKWETATNTIVAHKFEDKNYNGVQDSGEFDLQDWTFTLTVPSGIT